MQGHHKDAVTKMYDSLRYMVTMFNLYELQQPKSKLILDSAHASHIQLEGRDEQIQQLIEELNNRTTLVEHLEGELQEANMLIHELQQDNVINVGAENEPAEKVEESVPSFLLS